MHHASSTSFIVDNIPSVRAITTAVKNLLSRDPLHPPDDSSVRVDSSLKSSPRHNLTAENYSRNDDDAGSGCCRGLLRCEWQCLTFHSRGNFNLNFSILLRVSAPPRSIRVTHHSSREMFAKDSQMHIFGEISPRRVVFDDWFPLVAAFVDRNSERQRSLRTRRVLDHWWICLKSWTKVDLPFLVILTTHVSFIEEVYRPFQMSKIEGFRYFIVSRLTKNCWHFKLP